VFFLFRFVVSAAKLSNKKKKMIFFRIFFHEKLDNLKFYVYLRDIKL